MMKRLRVIVGVSAGLLVCYLFLHPSLDRATFQWCKQEHNNYTLGQGQRVLPANDQLTSKLGGNEAQDDEGRLLADPAPDLLEREQWQQHQVDHYCRKYNITGVKYQLPSDSASRARLLYNLIFVDENEVVFAGIPKVGSTNLRRFVFLLQGLLSNSTIHKERIPYSLVQRAMRINHERDRHTSRYERTKKLKEYYKYTFIRNPLERLVSAYRNKIAPPKQYLKERWVTGVKQGIMTTSGVQEWSKDSNVTFTQYIRWVIATPNNHLNKHIAPVIENIYPCRVRYNFYGNFKQLTNDMHMVIKRLQAPMEYFWNTSYYEAGSQTDQMLDHHYSQLDMELKHNLFRDFYQELDFYYHLYPEERDSHCELLDVSELIV